MVHGSKGERKECPSVLEGEKLLLRFLLGKKPSFFETTLSFERVSIFVPFVTGVRWPGLRPSFLSIITHMDEQGICDEFWTKPSLFSGGRMGDWRKTASFPQSDGRLFPGFFSLLEQRKKGGGGSRLESTPSSKHT